VLTFAPSVKIVVSSVAVAQMSNTPSVQLSKPALANYPKDKLVNIKATKKSKCFSD